MPLPQLQLHVDHILSHSGVVDQLHDVIFVARIGVPGHLYQVGCPCLRVLATAPFWRCSRLQGRSSSPPAAASRHGGDGKHVRYLVLLPKSSCGKFIGERITTYRVLKTLKVDGCHYHECINLHSHFFSTRPGILDRMNATSV